MPDTYRVGIAGLIHDHIWGMLRWWKELHGAEIVSAADANPPLRERIRAEYGVERLYETPAQMFEAEKLDIVTVAVDNAGTADVVEQAAAQGIQIISEKPMSATVEQARRMLQAARRAGVQLMINWPTAWNPAWQTLDRLARGGAIGQLWQTRYRAAHQGPKEIGCSEYFYTWLYDRQRNGAGALMDYCCYGADMASHWLGRPESVVGAGGRLLKDTIDVEDNAILLIRYPHALAVAEASWTQAAGDGGANPSVYGTAGTLSIVGSRVRLARGDRDVEWVEPEPPAPGRRNGAEYLVSCLRSGTPVEGLCSPEVSLVAQEILEAGLRSVETGAEVRL